MKKNIKIGSHLVGDNEPCFIIAEIGINHNGDINLAKKLMLLAKECGCDLVKFQKRNPDVCVPETKKNEMRETPWGYITYLEYKKKIEFEKEEFKFPDEAEDKGKPLDEVEYIIEDDTPPEDRGREPLPTEVVKKLEVADEDNEELDPKAQKERIKQYKKVWNDERRAKEDAQREQQAAIIWQNE